MKATKKKILYGVLEVLFTGIAPLVFLCVQYGNIGSTAEAVGFKVSITGILLAVVVFLILKKTVVARYLSDVNQQSNNYVAVLNTETDETKLANAAKALRKGRTVETISRAVLPLLLLLAALVCCKALEAELVKLSGALGFILVGYLIGTVFGVLGAREVGHRR